MTLLQNCYQIKISRYSTTEKYYGNIWLIIMVLQVFIVTSVIISGNILNSIHISEKADHQIPIRLLSDMKHLWADRLSLIGRIPLMYYNKEKASLNSLPADNIRKPYQITTNTVKVNHSSMFNYKGCQYSVPPEYIDKIVSL